ncbi:MAG: ribosomal-protein-alanine N-acetyltransferase [Hadesarchaea archaeon]|nr:MAG: ribosomal-protein-alanine N-acetyltransferase [Hadesarchaea archaeon]TDA36458.1 MAG: ribosomal-protein-alanine N-acetyltransferase [Hadesarchaea archaeon]
MVVVKEIKVINLKEEDLQEVMELGYKCFPDPYPLSLLEHLYKSDPQGFFGVKMDGKLVGYLICTMRWGGIGHILSIAVDPEYRRRGVGRALIQRALERLRKEGATAVRLEARKSNLGARAFYSVLGFKEERELPHYYEDGETAVLMWYTYPT